METLRWLTPDISQEELSRMLPDLQRLLAQLVQHPEPLTVERLTQVVKHSHLLIVQEAEKGDQTERSIIGTALLIPQYKLNTFEGRVEGVVVDEVCRGRGIGRKMMEELIVYGRDVLHVSRLELTSGPSRMSARELYRSLNFKERETGTFRLDF